MTRASRIPNCSNHSLAFVLLGTLVLSTLISSNNNNNWPGVQAFAPVPLTFGAQTRLSAVALPNDGSRQSSSSPSTTTTTTTQRKSKRRKLLVMMRRVALLGAGGSAVRKAASLSSNDHDHVPTGRVVEFTVHNLEGDRSQSGVVRLQLEPRWARRGVARFTELVEDQFFANCRVFRVLPGFGAQFGIHGSPATQAQWRSRTIRDDDDHDNNSSSNNEQQQQYPPHQPVSNTRGTVVFATAGPHSRTTQLFVNTADNVFLDREPGFAPIGKVIQGMEYVDRFYAGYRQGGPNPGKIQSQGNAYLLKDYPNLSYIGNVRFVS